LADAQRELRQAQLQQRYDAAMELYRGLAWPEAVHELQALATEEPSFLDVSARLGDARHQLDLQQQVDEARKKLSAQMFADGIPLMASVCSSDYSGAAQACAEVTQAHKDYATDLVRQADTAYQAKRWVDVERLAHRPAAHLPS
jgi:hypothetical protein